jgi:transposase
MYHRHAIRDEDWERLKDLLPGREGQRGVTAKDNRLFLDAVLWIAKTGAPWRDLPERFGKWNSVWRRFDRWASRKAREGNRPADRAIASVLARASPARKLPADVSRPATPF